MASDGEDLPRLLYVGDVPVEAGMGGSALIYRLLCEYPQERLMVVQGREGNALGRLPGVRYEAGTPIGFVPSRWPGVHAMLSAVRAHFVAGPLARQVGSFRPDAVVTISHDCGWITAWRLARRLRLPFHMICHDDWEPTVPVWRWFRVWARGWFAGAYRDAASRLCVSPCMAAHYAKQFGVPGTVLYPSRAKDVVVPTGPPEPRDARMFTVAHAGSVHAAFAPTLRALAAALESIGGRLLIVSNLSTSVADTLGLVAPTVVLEPAMNPAALVPYLRRNADALFLVTTEVGLNTRISFPSKLVDYTATGLPIVVAAPEESAPAYWVREHVAAAIFVRTGDDAGLREAITSLLNHQERRIDLGKRAQAIGNEQFDYARVRDTFLQALMPSGLARQTEC